MTNKKRLLAMPISYKRNIYILIEIIVNKMTYCLIFGSLNLKNNDTHKMSLLFLHYYNNYKNEYFLPIINYCKFYLIVSHKF